MHSALPVRAGNHVIRVPGIGANKPFSVLVADRMPDLHFLEFGQCFPRWVYPGHGGIFREAEIYSNELERVENITDVALLAFRQQQANGRITKDSLFYYVYGVLHAPTYRERFPNDLAQALPRIPMAPDSDAVAEAGRELADLHLGCESGPEYSPKVQLLKGEELGPEHCRIGRSKIRWLTGKSVLRVNDRLCLTRITAAAPA